MGLDQFFFKLKKKDDSKEIYYLRKVNPLQGFFEDNEEPYMDPYSYKFDFNVYKRLKKALEETSEIINPAFEVFNEGTRKLKKEWSDEEKNKYFEELNTKIEKEFEKILETKVPPLHPTNGPFYGNYKYNIWYLQDILEIEECLSALEDIVIDLEEVDDEELIYHAWY